MKGRDLTFCQSGLTKTIVNDIVFYERYRFPRWACGAFTASAEIIAGVGCRLDERQFEDGAVHAR